MPIYKKRVLDLASLLSERSLFLMGPRQTGNRSQGIKELRGIY